MSKFLTHNNNDNRALKTAELIMMPTSGNIKWFHEAIYNIHKHTLKVPKIKSSLNC